MPEAFVIKPLHYNNSYGVVVARSIDILCASWVWRDYDITISSMAGLECRKARPRRWAVLLNAFLNWVETNHCELAIEADQERARQALAILQQQVSP